MYYSIDCLYKKLLNQFFNKLGVTADYVMYNIQKYDVRNIYIIYTPIYV